MKQGLPKLILDRKKLQNTSLSKKELSIILGGLLGDGSLKIHTGYKNARYSFRHSIRQKSYFLYKANCLKSISSPGSIQLQKPDGWSKLDKLRFSSKALSCLTEIHSITHFSNKLKVQRRWLNHLTAQSLAIWWFDDGSIIGGGRKGCISTDNFTLQENLILVQYLKVIWKIEARIYPVKNYSTSKTNFFPGDKDLESFKPWGYLLVLRSKKALIVCSRKKKHPLKGFHLGKGRFLCQKQEHPRKVTKTYRLYLSTGALKQFLTIILPFVPSSEILYKCHIKYKNIHLQQRWISHMISLLPEKFHCLFK